MGERLAPPDLPDGKGVHPSASSDSNRFGVQQVSLIRLDQRVNSFSHKEDFTSLCPLLYLTELSPMYDVMNGGPAVLRGAVYLGSERPIYSFTEIMLSSPEREIILHTSREWRWR